MQILLIQDTSMILVVSQARRYQFAYGVTTYHQDKLSTRYQDAIDGVNLSTIYQHAISDLTTYQQQEKKSRWLSSKT